MPALVAQARLTDGRRGRFLVQAVVTGVGLTGSAAIGDQLGQMRVLHDHMVRL